MKIALCLQGQPRNWRVGYTHLNKHIISIYDTDVFCHTWWAEDMVGESYNTSPWAPGYKIEANLPEKISSIYNFKKFQYERPIRFVSQRQYNIVGDHEAIYQAINSRFYSLNRVLVQCKQYEKEKNIDYDWVIITRTDIGIDQLINLNSPQYTKDKIYVSHFHRRRKYIFNDNMWICGKDRKYDFIGLFNDFDKDYDMQQNIMQTEYAQVLINSELWDFKNLVAESQMVYHLLFKGVLDKVEELDNLEYNVVRE